MKTAEPNQSINTFLKVAILSMLIIFSFMIAKPFLLLMIWAIIVAVALYPFYKKVLGWFNGKKKGLVTTIFIGALLAIIIVPSLSMTNSIIDSTSSMYKAFDAGELHISPPDISVKEWPLIGEKLYALWNDASSDLQSFIKNYPDQVLSSVGWFFSSFTGIAGSLLLSIVALLISGAFMSNAEGGFKEGVALANKLTNGNGESLMKMSTNTIRSVVKGILLVAIIQSILAFFGFQLIGLSTAGILSFVVLLCAVIQLPVTLVMIPIIIYVFSFADTTPAIIFAIYATVVSLLDNVLKPMLLAKGLETPMLVILIGALGGMMLFGILGLFVGPVILALSHRLYVNWVYQN
ncbi:AI-2E family transporter [Urechidicola sp. KH5]